jgi:peroxiredoxin
VSKTPAAVLVGPRGDVLWKGESALTAKKLADALGKHAKAGGEIATIPIRLAVRLGEPPPDVPLRLGGSELSLRRLKGRAVALGFYTRRSGPSLDHLEFLRDVASTGGKRSPLVVAVGDGESAERVAEVVKQRELPFLVLPDPDRLLSRAFGVWCWPATVWIRPDLKVEAVDFGSSASPASVPPSDYGRPPAY